jgi:membrane protease YdiL (CAAX protease family)
MTLRDKACFSLVLGRLPWRAASLLAQANLVQALLFLIPHFAILLIAPEVWVLLPVVFAGALVFGWIRIKSGSIVGPWPMHASGNVTMALMVAVRTST